MLRSGANVLRVLRVRPQAVPSLADGQPALDQRAKPRVLCQELLGGVPLRRAAGQPEHEEGSVPSGRSDHLINQRLGRFLRWPRSLMEFCRSDIKGRRVRALTSFFDAVYHTLAPPSQTVVAAFIDAITDRSPVVSDAEQHQSDVIHQSGRANAAIGTKLAAG